MQKLVSLRAHFSGRQGVRKGNIVCCSVLQCVAVCCSVVQCVAVCCRVLQSVAVCCSVLQCVAACCSVLQCVSLCCSVLKCVQYFDESVCRTHFTNESICGTRLTNEFIKDDAHNYQSTDLLLVYKIMNKKMSAKLVSQMDSSKMMRTIISLQIYY